MFKKKRSHDNDYTAFFKIYIIKFIITLKVACHDGTPTCKLNCSFIYGSK